MTFGWRTLLYFDKVIDGKKNYVNNEAKRSEFIGNAKRWQLDNLRIVYLLIL